MKLHVPSSLLAGLVLLGAAAVGAAQIERLDLPKMVHKADGAVFGTIVDREVIRIDHPVDGPELYFTHLTIEGRSLITGDLETVVVTYYGGFIDAEHGVYCSEAPSDDDVQLGNQVVAFYAWTDNMGGDLAANALYASHGGLFRTAKSPSGATIVLGRGEGYAVSANIPLDELDQEIRRLAR